MICHIESNFRGKFYKLRHNAEKFWLIDLFIYKLWVLQIFLERFSNPAQMLELPTYIMQMPTLLGRRIEIEFWLNWYVKQSKKGVSTFLK